jgi:hypothetical protein
VFRDGSVLARLGWRGLLAVGLAAVIVGAVLLARISGLRPDRATAGPSSGGTPTATALVPDDGLAPLTTPASSPTGPPEGDVLSPSATADPAAVTAAEAFARAWANHPAGMTAAAWWAGVSKYTDGALAEDLRSTEPARVPANRVTGSAASVFISPTSAQFEVPTDRGMLQVVCVQMSGGWLVTSIDFTPVG